MSMLLLVSLLLLKFCCSFCCWYLRSCRRPVVAGIPSIAGFLAVTGVSVSAAMPAVVGNSVVVG